MIFLIKKDVDIEKISFKQVNEDMIKILKKAEIMKEN